MEVDELADKIIIVSGGDFRKLMCLLIKCLEIIPFEIPQEGRVAIEVAKKFWNERKGSSKDLEKVRVKCWKYVDRNSVFTKEREGKELFALRAIICILYPEPQSDDVYEVVDFFIEMLHSIFVEHSVDNFLPGIFSKINIFLEMEEI